MAFQADLPAPVYGFTGKGARERRRRYLEGAQRGYLEDDRALEAFFEEALERARRRR